MAADDGFLSSGSSALSTPASTPPPPSHRMLLPSPSPSQSSSTKVSPSPEAMLRAVADAAAAAARSGADDDGPARKRRRLAEPKPRTTQHLDLRPGCALDDAAQTAEFTRLIKALRKKRKIVVIAGAGISVSAGIPDFRSSNGLFSSLRKQHNVKSSGKHLFDASVYRDDSSTSSFHDMVRQLCEKTKDAKPTLFHHLLATLSQEDRLLRLYTQNVDGIENQLPPLKTEVPLPKKAPWPKTVQLHGGLAKMVCSKCHTLADFNPELFQGPVPPPCSECEQADEVRNVAGKRSHGIGRLRPRMVLYNEHNPDEDAIGSIASADLRARPDAVIVAGTTLKVPGVRRIAREMCNVVRDRRDGLTVWINNDPEPVGKDLENCWDLVVRGTCDEVARLAAMRKYDEPEEELVTEEHLARVKKEQGEVQVLIETPRKPKAFQHLLTPGATPRLSPQPAGPDVPEGMPLTRPPMANPASKGRKIVNLSGVAATGVKKAASKPRKAPAKKAATKTTAKSTAKITASFTVSKPTTQASSKAPKSTTATSQTSKKAPTKSHIKPKKTDTTTIAQPMHPISPQAACNNSSPPHPPEVKSIFPGLMKPRAPPPAAIKTDCTSESVSKYRRETISPRSKPMGMDNLIE